MKIKQLSLYVALASMTGVYPTISQDTNLGIAPAGNQLIIYWPTSITNYVLQTTTNLASPDWVTVSNAVTVNALVVTNTAPSAFFQLTPQVPNPQIGWVDFPPPNFTSLFHAGTTSGVTLNNDVPIVIESTQGSVAYYSYSNTPFINSVPDPTSASDYAPMGYVDGLFSVTGLRVAQILPDLSIKAIAEQFRHANSAVVSALFQFVVGNPNIVGTNAAQFTVTDITLGAQMYYTSDGTDPTNDGSGTSLGPISSGQTLSLNFGSSTNLLFKIRGFRTNYHPSSTVSNLFSKNN